MKKKIKEKDILIVDDEKELCMGLENLIGAQGYRVRSIFDGKKAIKEFAKEPASLVILDLKLPGLSGEKVFDRLKAIRPKTKVIVLTGHGTIQSAAQLTRRGVSGYLQKPFKPTQLLDLIQKEIGAGNEAKLAGELFLAIGQKIRLLREKEGWTLNQLAERTNLSPSLISQVENGNLSASLETLFKISRSFRVPIRNFF